MARERLAAGHREAIARFDEPARLNDEPYRVLHEEVARLPEKYRAAVVLCYFEGLTHEQAAESLHWPVGTVRGYLARARDLLRSRLVGRGVAPTLTATLLAPRLASAATAFEPALAEAIGRAISRGSATTTVAALAGSIGRGFALARIRRAAVILVVASLGLGGVGLTTAYLRYAAPGENSLMSAGTQIPPNSDALPDVAALGSGGAGMTGAHVQASAPRENSLMSAGTRIPLSSDALPEDATARLGALRFNHGGDLRGVAFALGGKSLLSFGRDGIARIWDAASGNEQYAIGGGEFHVQSFALSHDGTSLMTFDGGGVIRQWELATRREQRRWHPSPAKASFDSMAFSADGKTLATAGLNDKGAYLWDVEKPGEPRRLEGDERSIWDIAFSPDGRMVATAAMDGIPRGGFGDIPNRPEVEPERGSVRLWDIAKGTEIRRFPVQGCHPRCLAFSPAGTILAGGFSDATIRLYELPTGKELARLDVKGPMQGCLSFSPDGRLLASGTHPHATRGGDSAAIHLWDVISRKELRQFPAHEQDVSGIAFSPDGKVLASGGAENALRLWDLTTGREINPSDAHRSGITCLVVSATGGSVITGGYDGTIRQWDPGTGRELRRIAKLTRPVHDLAIAPDGKLLISASLWGMVQLWDLSTSREVHRLIESNRGRRASGLAFTSDGRIVTAAGRIWDAATGRELAALRDDEGKAFQPWASASVLFASDGKSVVSWGNRDVRFWDTESGREIRRIVVPQPVFSIALAPDGRFLATGLQADHTIRLWHVASGREVAKLSGLGDVSPTLAFSPDGRLLASGSGDYTQSVDRSVRLWELVSGREVRRFDWHRAGVTRVAFLPDGRSLVSSSADATALVWDITGLGRARPLPAKSISRVELASLWSNLAGDDAAQGYRAIWTLTAVPELAIPFLADRLKPIEPNDPEKDTTLGPIARGETLRRLRAITVLEKIGTPEARRVLERLASGLAGARETRDAKATLRRLDRR